MTKSRWFRALICLLIVCCLIFHMSPIKAEALALEASLAIGLVGALILASAGVVFVPETTNQIQAIGQSFQNYMTQWGTANNKQAEVQDWFFGLQFYDPGDDGDEEDDDWVSPTNRKVKLARGILAGISAWCASIILGNIQVEVEETVPEGYAYYNGVLLPILPEYDTDRYPYAVIVWNSYLDSYRLVVSTLPMGSTSGKNFCNLNDDVNYYLSSYLYDYTSWNFNDESQYFANYKPDAAYTTWIWANYDITNKTGTNVYLTASDPPLAVQTEIIEPSSYVGDIPQQIQDGELEPGGIELPDINYDPLIQPGVSLQDSTIGTLHKLSTGELSYENYLQQIKVDGSSTDPLDPTPQPSEPSQDEDKWEPPTNPGKFAVDLKDFFPFCIPFDLYDFFSCLNADPVAPVIDWAIPLPGGSSYPITIDLSIFDPVAKILRTMELLLFCVGLAFKTRDLIRG